MAKTKSTKPVPAPVAPRKLSADERTSLQELIDQRSLDEVARLLGMANNTLRAVASGVPVQRGTIALVQVGLQRLRDAL